MAGDRGYAPRPWVSKTHVLLLYESPLIKSAEIAPIHSAKLTYNFKLVLRTSLPLSEICEGSYSLIDIVVSTPFT